MIKKLFVKPLVFFLRLSIKLRCSNLPHMLNLLNKLNMWLGGVAVMVLDLRLEIAGSIPAAALSSANLDKLFTHIVQRL